MESAFLSEGLGRGLLNLSKLARQLQPQLEKDLWKPVGQAAVVMALRRLADRLSQQTKDKLLLSPSYAGELSIRSELMIFTYHYSDQSYVYQRQLLALAEPQRDIFITVMRGVNEVMVICSRTLGNLVQEVFSDERERARLERVTAVTLHLSPETCYTPGIYHAILKRLAWERINLINIICTYTELTFLLEAKQAGAAFSVLSQIATL
ncbi:hypothetical protein [Janthinobacterium sp. Ant5-2-1]|uniref:hypothetical protein n=1 Tax=Janthinobacterium sp. Ant5-2-1 TaxID=1755239 RepID=UPI000A5004B0|nr:hypothetical protein [Janthinobacterium sp. Ant5-2-1]